MLGSNASLSSAQICEPDLPASYRLLLPGLHVLNRSHFLQKHPLSFQQEQLLHHTHHTEEQQGCKEPCCCSGPGQQGSSPSNPLD